MTSTSTHFSRTAGAIETTAVALILYQAIRTLFSVLFGLIYDALFAESASLAVAGAVLVVVFLAWLTPLAAPRRPEGQRLALLVGAVLVFLARISLTFNDPVQRLVASITIVAAGGLYVAARLRHTPRTVAQALVVALIADQLLRAAGHTWDVTLRPAWWPGQVAVSLLLCLLAAWLYRVRGTERLIAMPPQGLLTGLVWAGWLFLQTSLLAFPNAMAHWSGENYLLFALSWPFVLALIFLGDGLWKTRRGPVDGLIVLACLLAGLAAGSLATGVVAFLGLLLAELASLVALLSCLSTSATSRPSRLRLGLALGGGLFVLLNFAYAFSFTYAYTLDIFRGIGLPVFLVAGVCLALPTVFLPASPGRVPRPSLARWFSVWGLAALLFAAVLVLAGGRGRVGPTAATALRIATYNIHYGYDSDWHLSLEAQAQAIEAMGADVVALQEVDTGRPTSYMIDDALWLAQRLNMQAVYLPCVEHLTGVALLSRLPVTEVEARLLPSELEQTGIVWARLETGDEPLNAFGTWLGLEPEERARQLEAILPFLAAHPGPATFAGDLNSTPESAVYLGLDTAGLVDPFVALGIDTPPSAPAIDPDKRIDFVWLRDLQPVAAWVPDTLASDHRPVVVEVRRP